MATSHLEKPAKTGGTESVRGRKGKRVLLTWILPLGLAACILCLGTWVPGVLLQRQAQTYTQQLSTVPVSDVRPYGDDYENMRQSLTSAIQMMDNEQLAWIETDQTQGSDSTQVVSGQDGVTIAAVSQEQLLQVRQGLWDFLNISWMSLTLDDTPVIERLLWESDETVKLIAEQSAGNQAVLVDCEDEATGAYSEFCTTVDTGIPVAADIYLVVDEPDYQSIWDNLLLAYQEQCGLNFGDTVLYYESSSYDLTDLDKLGLTVKDLADYSQWCSFSAVSSDLSFRLTVEMLYSKEQVLFIEFSLRLNNS
jgi:hypothetical protein